MEASIQYTDRCLGTTKGIILKFLGELLINPNKELALPIDHYDADSERSRYRMKHNLRDEISRQELSFIKINDKRNTAIYQPFGQVKQGWEIIE